jgi:hydrogenase maturation protease
VTDRVLVAGVGNIFFTDDAFGPAVATALSSRAVPDGVRVVDYGIRGTHLAYDLLDGVDALVLIDALPARAGSDGTPDAPGTITVLEVGPDDVGGNGFDAHSLSPVSVLSSVEPMGGTLPPTFVVGCVPADVSEGLGLSQPVAAAVEPAVTTVLELVDRLVRVGAVRDRGR